MRRAGTAGEILLSFACGIGLALAYPRASLALLAWIVPVPWLARGLARTPWGGFCHGMLFGLGFFGLLLGWVHGVLGTYTALPALLTVPIWLLLVAYLSVYTGLFGLFVAALSRLAGVWALAAAPVLWVGLEFARGRVLGGFPWGTLGCARAGGLPLLQAASVGGVALVSLMIAAAWSSLAAILIAWAVPREGGRAATARVLSLLLGPAQRLPRPPMRGRGVLAAIACITLVAAAWLAGMYRLRAHPAVPDAALFERAAGTQGWLPLPGTPNTSLAGPSAPSDDRDPGRRDPDAPPLALRMALVQGGYGGDLRYELGPRVLTDYLDLSREAAAAASPALIVWPESSAPYQPDADEAYRRILQKLSRDTGALLLMGAVGGDAAHGLTNSAWLIGPDGILARYDKRRLVPFGEYVPLARFLPFVSKFVPEVGEFLPGEAPGVIRANGRSLGVAICYEIVFPEEILIKARGGAEIVVNLTNDSWYTGGGPWQHAEFASVRAIETGLWLARAASTGRTLIVDPYGRLRAGGPLGGSAVLLASPPAPPPSEVGRGTLFVRWGEWVGKLCATLTAAALALVFAGNKIVAWRSGSEAPPAEGTTGR